MAQVYNVSDWNVTIPETDVHAHAHGLTFNRLSGLWWLTHPDR
jgi:hypothetical protein